MPKDIPEDILEDVPVINHPDHAHKRLFKLVKKYTKYSRHLLSALMDTHMEIMQL